jgi:hypothetical protein
MPLNLKPLLQFEEKAKNFNDKKLLQIFIKKIQK